MGDLVGGINGPIAILAALYEREKTGKGCLIDISLLDGMFGLLSYLPQMAWFNDTDPAPQGSQHPNLVPYGSFAASDGSIVIACLMNSFWGNICQALGMDDWADDDRFNSLEKRRDARDEINARIESLTTLKTVGELVGIFTAHQVPHAPILAVREALAQPQAVAREMVVQTQHKTLGQIPIVNRSIRYVDAPQPPPSAPPVLGEHSDAVLRDILHFSDDKIAELRMNSIVF
jgi:crotonobetainyl-CoA:carnitine CoA-transferase CaiB-like acyl-CoA transferase